MKKFRFSLATLLQVRIQQEEIANKNLMEAHLILKKNLLDLEILNQERENIKNNIRQIQMNMQNSYAVTRFYEYLHVIKNKILNQTLLANEAKLSVEIRRREVIRAMHQRKIIDNLREKRLDEWETSYYAKEHQFFDELATMRYGRKNTKK